MNSKKILNKISKNHMWYPFTQMKELESEDSLIIESANGCVLKDIEGKEYIDGVSSLWTNVHGHNHPVINNAIKSQVDKISHSTLLGQSNIPAIELAEKLVKITPEGLNRVFYSDSGSTAVEIALKMAFQYHQQSSFGSKNKKKFISYKNAYHGDTIGSVSVGGIDLFHMIYGLLLFDSYKAESPYSYRLNGGVSEKECLEICINQLESIMQKHASEVAALIIEPLVQGAAGLIMHPKGYLKEVRKLCTKYDIIMICDEVAVGFGKTGTMFACEQEGVQPDILAIAKGISGGYIPLAATLTTDQIYEAFLGEYDEYKTFFHGHTYTGNQLACVSALANLEIFEKEETLKKLQPKIKLFQDELQIMSNLKHVGEVRQTGIMIAIELVKNKQTRESFSPKLRIGHKVILEARKQGLILRPLGDIIVIMPPLAISEDEIETIIEITYNSIKKVTENVVYEQ